MAIKEVNICSPCVSVLSYISPPISRDHLYHSHDSSDYWTKPASGVLWYGFSSFFLVGLGLDVSGHSIRGASVCEFVLYMCDRAFLFHIPHFSNWPYHVCTVMDIHGLHFVIFFLSLFCLFWVSDMHVSFPLACQYNTVPLANTQVPLPLSFTHDWRI